MQDTGSAGNYSLTTAMAAQGRPGRGVSASGVQPQPQPPQPQAQAQAQAQPQPQAQAQAQAPALANANAQAPARRLLLVRFVELERELAARERLRRELRACVAQRGAAQRRGA